MAEVVELFPGLFVIDLWGFDLTEEQMAELEVTKNYDPETDSYYYTTAPVGVARASELSIMLHDTGSSGVSMGIRPYYTRHNPYVVIDLTNAPDDDRALIDGMLDHLFSIAQGEVTESPINGWEQPKDKREGMCVSWKTQQ